MDKLPRIALRTPVQTESIEAKEYPDAFLSLLVVRASADNGKYAKATIELRNYDWEAEQTQPSEQARPWHYELPDLYAEMDRVPVLAEAAGYLLRAVSLLRAEQDILTAIESLPKDDNGELGPMELIEWSALQSHLLDVHRMMGIKE